MIVLTDRDLANLIAHARAAGRACRAGGDTAMAERWEHQALLWATDPRAAARHLYGRDWRDQLRARVDPATAEWFARLAATGRKRDDRPRPVGRVARPHSTRRGPAPRVPR